MRKLVAIFLVILTAACANREPAIHYTNPGFYIGPVLIMKIVPTFSQPKIYSVSRGEPYTLTVTVFEGKGGYDWQRVKSVREVQLSKKEYDVVIETLEKALGFPKNDDVMGYDGDTWMLESSLYQYTAVAFWEPEYNTEQRGIESFVELKNHLSKLSAQ